MITCTWNLRRHASRAAAIASAAALTSGLVLSGAVGQAHAASLPQLRAEAAALASRIQSLGLREAALSEQYDAATLALQQTEVKVDDARKALDAASAAAAHARSVLQNAAVNAYVNAGGSSVPASPSLSSANDSLLRTEYEQSLANAQAAAENAYRTASLEDATAETNLRHEEAAAKANVDAITSARSQVVATQGQLQSAYSSDQGQIATLVAQQEAAQQAAAQRAAELLARQRAAEQAAAAAATSSTSTTAAPTGGTTSTPADTTSTAGSSGTAGNSGTTGNSGSSGGSGGSGFTPPPSSSAAQIAVAAAESRVGDPYVWGGAGPNDFDCSGLVMWAYEQAGIDLPHYSGAQYADTVHIPMSDLEPGDLVFFSDPGEHVAMYVGNGDVVQAPYTGADVQIVPLYSEFTLASRVE